MLAKPALPVSTITRGLAPPRRGEDIAAMKTASTLLSLCLALFAPACGGGEHHEHEGEHHAHSEGGEQPCGDQCERPCAGHEGEHGEHGEGHHGEGHGGEHHGEGHHGEGHHPQMPASLTALHDVLRPVWHSEPGAARAGLACTNAARLDTESRAVAAAAAPAGVDAAAWRTAATQLTTTCAALVAECSASGPAVESKLTTYHDAFHGLVDLARH
jgi:hypothetical protein